MADSFYLNPVQAKGLADFFFDGKNIVLLVIVAIAVVDLFAILVFIPRLKK